ncbi:MAG: YgjV family protein [Clostridia bacterium]|nr:YgjV family protein [Clostridia bacterium]
MLDFFQNMTALEIAAQGIGVCATILAILSFQQKTQKSIVFFQLLNNVLWTAHFLMLGAWAGGLLNAIGIFRGLVFCFRGEKEWARSPVWYGVFSLAFIGASVFAWIQGDGALALLPLAGMLFTTVSLSLRDPFRVRVISFFSSPCWLTYNIINASIPGAFTEIFMMCSILIGILRIDLPRMRAERAERAH